MIFRSLYILVTFIFLTTHGRADLLPAEVAIVAAKDNRQSIGLANYYAKQRNIPADNICQVELPDSEEIDRATWDRTVRPAIRSWLEQSGRRDQIRCIVTTWGIPIRIGPAPPEAIAHYRDFYRSEFESRIKSIAAVVTAAEEQVQGKGKKEFGTNQDIEADLESIADGPGDGNTANGMESIEELGKRLEAAVSKMQAAAKDLPPDEMQQFGRSLQQIVTQAGGLTAMYDGFARSAQNASTLSRPQIEQTGMLRGQIIGLTESRGLIERFQLPSVEREQASLILIQRAGGLIQALRWLDEQQKSIEKNETMSSFDSELSLALWPEYELLRWQTNFLHAGSRNAWIEESHPTMMVSRIDAPTLVLAKGLIDQAIAVEKQGGLKGKIYLDARGLAESSTAAIGADMTASFDQQILRAAEYLKANSSIDVVLNDKAELFQPGDCPDAALYCGWYSLAKYVDAFEWSPGAIGYHVASSEAVTLKNADSNAWCKRMLEDGVCATLGPVTEPYLQSFPPPGDFFARLVGNYTLVEAYYRTSPYNSWAMMLIGDPLYRPFGKSE